MAQTTFFGADRIIFFNAASGAHLVSVTIPSSIALPTLAADAVNTMGGASIFPVASRNTTAERRDEPDRQGMPGLSSRR